MPGDAHSAAPYNRAMRFAPIGIASVLACSFGCSETPAPVAPTAPVAQVAAAPAAAPAAPDLAPVAEPADIFVVARWKNPHTTLSSVATCAGVPADLAETGVHHLVDRALSEAFRGVDGKAIADAVSFDASLDLVASLEPGRRGVPQALLAFSVPLTSLDRVRGALEAGGPLTELAPGLYRVGKQDSGDLACVLGAAAGAAPARLICGPHEKDVVALGPYLARNLPIAPLPEKDLHAELRFATIDARYGGEIRRGVGLLPNFARMKTINNPHYDRALEEAAQALADEGAALAGDLDRLTIDLGPDGASCLNAAGALQFKGKSSWLAGTVANSADHAGPPPAIFWRTPIDAESASFSRGADGSRYSGIVRVLRALLEGRLAKENIGSDADRKALSALLGFSLAKDTSVVVASGHNVTKPAPPGTKLAPVDVVDGYLGWYVLGFDEKSDGIAKLMKEVVDVYKRKAFSDVLRQVAADDVDMLPAAKFVPAPKELGKGALDLELTFDPQQHGIVKKGLSFAIHVLLMSDGKSTWVGLGAKREELVKRLVATKSGAPDSGTLAARPGLEAIKSGKAVSNGFLTLGLFTHRLATTLGNPDLVASAGSRASVLADLVNVIDNLPHRGATPIFLTGNATAAGPRTDFVISIQKGSFEDLGALVLNGLRVAQSGGLLPGARP